MLRSGFFLFINRFFELGCDQSNLQPQWQGSSNCNLQEEWNPSDGGIWFDWIGETCQALAEWLRHLFRLLHSPGGICKGIFSPHLPLRLVSFSETPQNNFQKNPLISRYNNDFFSYLYDNPITKTIPEIITTKFTTNHNQNIIIQTSFTNKKHPNKTKSHYDWTCTRMITKASTTRIRH